MLVTGYRHKYITSDDCLQNAARFVDRLAAEALLQEVLATPKPGLVDSVNNGAHKDMSYSTFKTSITSMQSYYGMCFKIGALTSDIPGSDVLKQLQILGLSAQENMYKATGGVNTHKGAIFSLGLLCGAAGRLWPGGNSTAEAICTTASDICRGLCSRTLAQLVYKPSEELSKGERMYIKYGMSGARGEAEKGFPTVKYISLPIYAQLIKQGFSVNSALVETLLHLIAHTEDTNIVSRHNRDAAEFASRTAKQCLRCGGFLKDGGRLRLEELDKKFISRNISPGGSADLLAVTYFLYNIKSLYN